MRSAAVSHWKLRTINWEDHRSWSSHNYRSCRVKLNVNHSMVIRHLKQTRKVKKLGKWVPYELTKKKKKSSFWSVFSYSTQQWTISQSDYDAQQKWILYDSWWHSCTVNELQSTSQCHTCTKNRLWSLFGGLLPVWSTIAFWIREKPLHLRSMLSKSVRCTKNCNDCSWHWSTERAQYFTTTNV